MTAHDLVTEALADSEHRLARELASVRELLHVAVTQLHERRRRDEQHAHLRNEYRQLRETHSRLLTSYRQLRDPDRKVA